MIVIADLPWLVCEVGDVCEAEGLQVDHPLHQSPPSEAGVIITPFYVL